MIIHLSPQYRHDTLEIAVRGDVLTINGEDLDFGQLDEGSVLPRGAVGSEWVASDVTRTDGEIVLTLILPHNAGANDAARYPQPIRVGVNGPVTLPGV